MSQYVQNVGATRTWLHDWAAFLTRAETDLGLTAGTLKLSSVTSVSGPTGTTVTSPTLNVAATGVTFKLATSLTPPQDVTLKTTVVLSNGDVEVEDLTITLTS